MTLSTALGLGQTALELGLINSLTVLALFLSYSMLNVCDLSTDGCFTLGACVGAVVAISGHPWLALPAAMCAGVVSGFVTALLQTRMGVESLLAGIIVNTALYSINIAVMGNSSLLNMNKTETVFTKASQTEYAIFMWSPAGATPSSPWARVRGFMSSEFLGMDNNWSGNWGHYKNDRADEIIAAIPLTTDEAELKALYTEW